MKTIEVPLGELATFQRGFDITKKEQEGGNVPVISSGGISSYHNVSKVKGPGIIIGRKGTLGTVFHSSEDFWPHDTTLWVKDFKGNDPLFLYYLLKTLRLERFDAGAANPTLNRNHIHRLKVVVPLFEERAAIGKVLSEYDSLIAINNDRISLLEEMAENVYSEWFLRYRYPNSHKKNHESDVPEGWTNGTLGDLIDIKKGKNITKSAVQDGEIPVVAGGINPSCYHNVANANGPVTTISSSGANSGFVKLYQQDIWASDCSYINQDVTETPYYYYLLLKLRQREIYNLQHGAAQPHVYPKDLARLEVTHPPSELIKEFEEVITGAFELRQNLINKNHLLVDMRDLLIPRLVCGKANVGSLLDGR